MNIHDDLDPRLFTDLVTDRIDDRLTPDEEQHLAAAIEAGVLAAAAPPGRLDETERRILVARGELARQRMILANLRLVSWVVALDWRSHERDDQFQEGVIGLDRAVRGYDHHRGGFAAYAITWIQEAVFTARAHRAGRGVRWLRDWYRLRGAEEALWQELGRSLGASELADRLGQPTWWVDDRKQGPSPILSNDIDTVDEADPSDSLFPAEQVNELLDRLDRLSRRVLEMRFGLDQRPHSRNEIGRILGLTAKQILGIEERALDQLRAVCPHHLGEYLAA